MSKPKQLTYTYDTATKEEGVDFHRTMMKLWEPEEQLEADLDFEPLMHGLALYLEYYELNGHSVLDGNARAKRGNTCLELFDIFYDRLETTMAEVSNPYPDPRKAK
jgi:hypothetical protein